MKKTIVSIVKWVWNETLLKVDPKKEKIEIGWVWMMLLSIKVYPDFRSWINIDDWAIIFFIAFQIFILYVAIRKTKIKEIYKRIPWSAYGNDQNNR